MKRLTLRSKTEAEMSTDEPGGAKRGRWALVSVDPETLQTEETVCPLKKSGGDTGEFFCQEVVRIVANAPQAPPEAHAVSEKAGTKNQEPKNMQYHDSWLWLNGFLSVVFQPFDAPGGAW